MNVHILKFGGSSFRQPETTLQLLGIWLIVGKQARAR